MRQKSKKNQYKQRVTLFVTTNPGFKVVLFFLAVILLSSIVVYLVERQSNDGFTSFFDSFWWTIVTISTVGYGDKYPITHSGRILAMGTILLGIGITATVTGRIASFLMERQMKEESGLLDYTNMKDHFIICGWKKEMNRVLYEILAFNPELNPLQIIILSRAAKEDLNTVRSDQELRGIKFVNGDFMEERDLTRAGIKGAAKILVLADILTHGGLQEIDSQTVMAVMAIKNLNKRAYVCAELLDTKFEKYLRLSHCDEILLSRDFSRSILASASSGTGLSHVVGSLLSGLDGVSISTRPIPPAFIGKQFRELRDHFLTSDSACNCIGLLENTGNISVRKKEALREVQKNPDISKIIPDLKSVKSLSANDPVFNPPDDYPILKYSSAVVIHGTNASRAAEALA